MTEEKREVYPKQQLATNGGETAILVGSKQFLITPNDDENLSRPCNIYISKSGNIRLSLLNDGDDVTDSILWAAQVGFYPLLVKKVWATDTDNTLQIIGIY